MIGVYLIVNLIDNKIYVGSSTNIDKRWNAHLSDFNNGTHDNVYFQRAWNKYGKECFKFYVIEYTSRDDLISREQHWIDNLKACDRSVGYNLSPTAVSVKGIKRSEDTKRKMGAWQIGRKLSEEVKLKMRKPKNLKPDFKGHKAWLGKKHSDETKAKISKSGKARPAFSEETRRRMSESRLAYFQRMRNIV